MFLLEARNLSVHYGGIQALDRVTCGVDAGEIVGIIGPNGAGKTTLLNAISGLTPHEGTVHFDGRDLRGHSPHLRARLGLARTLQGVDLFAGLSVLEHLHLLARISMRTRSTDLVAPVRDRVAAAATFVGIESDLKRQIRELPGGRQRLVDVAAAVCLRPRCLLLDEPAAGMGPLETAQLGRMFLRIREALGLGILLIEHDVEMVLDVADYVYVLDFGRLIAQGVPSDIRRDPAVIAAYLGQEPVEERAEQGLTLSTVGPAAVPMGAGRDGHAPR